jgi:hypothetical protein
MSSKKLITSAGVQNWQDASCKKHIVHGLQLGEHSTSCILDRGEVQRGLMAAEFHRLQWCLMRQTIFQESL